MSLDVAHLKSKWKGTLYVALVKTPCDEIFPVAIVILNNNENKEGWLWFLKLLWASCPFLYGDHPNPTIAHKYYNFILDRQKGLINALSEVFPHNYTMFCCIHIACNAEKFAGGKIASQVYSLSKTSSHFVAGSILDDISKISVRAREFVEDISEEQWRGTAWLDNPGLPPRFGIYKLNMSESVNNMFEKACDKSWLFSLDMILTTMMK